MAAKCCPKGTAVVSLLLSHHSKWGYEYAAGKYVLNSDFCLEGCYTVKLFQFIPEVSSDSYRPWGRGAQRQPNSFQSHVSLIEHAE